MSTIEVDASLDEVVASVLYDSTDVVEGDAAEIASEIADVLIREIPELSSDDATRSDIIRRARVGLLLFARDLRRQAPPAERRPAAESFAYARYLARRRVPIDMFLRIHRLAFAVMLRAWEDRLATTESAAVILAATRRLTRDLFAHHDAELQALTAEYQRERERFARSAEAQRRQIIEAILSEQAVDVDRVNAILRYDLRRWHVALTLYARARPEEPSVVLRLERAATAAAQRLGCGRPLTLIDSGGTMWAWLGIDSAPDSAAFAAFAASVGADSVSVSIGEPGRGVDGFRHSHRDAVDAARVARLGKRAPGVVTAYRQVELAALLSHDLERTRRFVLEQLGPLASADDNAARLRATLLIYLEESGSRVTTAGRLGIHPNTVANRIKACRDLVGSDLCGRPVRLQVALSLAGTLRAAILEGES